MRPVGSLFLVVIVCLCCSAVAQDSASKDHSELSRVQYPALVQQAASPEGFVPAGWGIEKKIEVDLNGDGDPDFVLVLHQMNPSNIFKIPDGGGADQYDSNPRILMVLFADKKSNGYKLIAQNHQLIPRLDSPTIDDPFDGIKIGKGNFSVDLIASDRVGSMIESDFSFRFRYQNGRMILIGYDKSTLHRGTGHYYSVSVNYLAKKAKIDNGSAVPMAAEPGKIKWVPLPADTTMPCLEQLGDGFEFKSPIPTTDPGM